VGAADGSQPGTTSPQARKNLRGVRSASQIYHRFSEGYETYDPKGAKSLLDELSGQR
jgi:hypothetical protein